jgi:asparagine synthase (glutamine-hydrolysing)
LFSDQKALKEGRRYCEELLAGYFNSGNAKDSLDKVFYTDIKSYLPEDILACTDRISMWHSLEARVPFLDHKLLEFCANIPNSLKIRGTKKKYILNKAYSAALPQEIFNHRKQGFIGPMTKWLQTDLKDFVSTTLSEARLNKHGIFNYDSVRKILYEHNNRIEIHDKLIWALLMFQLWYEKYFE